MKRLFAAFCALVMVLSVVNPAVFAAETTVAAANGTETFSSLQAAVDAYADGVIVLNEDAENLVVTKDVYVDLNGHDIAGVTVTAGTLYCMDSETDDYTVKDGIYGKLTGVSGNVAGVPVEAACAEHGYLKVAEEDGISFHCVNLKINSMVLRASEVGVYYKSYFAGDELVAAQVESFGVALSVVAAPDASNLETYCGYSVFKNFRAGNGSNSGNATGTLLRDVMKLTNSDKVNARNANMPVFGRAYIKTAEGYMFGAAVNRSLRQQVEAVDAKWAELTTQKAPISAMYGAYTAVMNAWNIPNIKGGDASAEGGVITVPVYAPAKNGVVTEDTVVNAKGVSITVPAGTKLAQGATQLTLTVTPKETSDAGLTLDEAEVLMPLDVHVDGVAADNTAPLTIYLGKVMAENLNMGNYAVYHVENGMANEMELIAADEAFTAHNQYKYTLDGELTLYMATFSEIAIRTNETNAWNGERSYTWYTKAIEADANTKVFYIRNADELAGLSALVGGMLGNSAVSFAGKTIILLADIDMGDGEENNDPDKIFYPIGYWNSSTNYNKDQAEAVNSYFKPFEGTFDGNGNTIKNIYQNTWEMKGDHNWYAPEDQHYRDGMGLFGYVQGGTIKNLTVDNFKSDGEIATTGVIAAYADSTTDNGVVFENIAITNCNPRVYNIGNGGIVGSVGWYSREDQTVQPVILRNISVDETNTISALWGSWDVGCGGLVGRYYPNAYEGDEYGIWLDNCHVAATIDVNNDVCGNYQYYWYRYCGMVIGTVEKSTSEGGADLTGIKVTDCEVDFGDRHEYYYCELVENSIASYTHDHQFSRLTPIKSVSEIQDAEGNWIKTGNFVIVTKNAETTSAVCYHIRKDAEGNFYEHDHNDYNGNGVEDKEIVNGVEVYVEDNRVVYLPFRQLFGGNGWGIKGVAEYENIDITILNGSVYKFEKAGTAQESYDAGATVTIGELFAAIEQAEIDNDNVQVFVSPADKTSTASGTYTANTTDWTQGTLSFSGVGAAKITITDYALCKATTINVTVVEPVELLPLELENGGKYVIAIQHNGQNLALPLFAGSGTQEGVSVTISDGKVTSDNPPAWTVVVSDNIVTFQNAEGKYLAYGGSGTSIKLSDTAYEWTVTRTVNGYQVVSAKTTNRALSYGLASNQLCFGAYANDQPGFAASYISDLNFYLVGKTCMHTNTEVIPGTAASCTETGLTDGLKCADCGLIITAQEEIPALGHNYVDGECTVCGEAEPTTAGAGRYYIATIRSSGNYFYMTSNLGTASTKRYQAVDSGLTELPAIIETPAAGYVFVLIDNGDGTYSIQAEGIEGDNYLGWTSGNSGALVAEASALKLTRAINDDGTYTFHFTGDAERYLALNESSSNNYFAWYKSGQKQNLVLIPVGACEHANTTEETEIAATCTEAGREAGTYCNDCETYIVGGAEIPALGHTEVIDAAVEPTCIATGLTEGAHCSVCGTVTVAQQVVNATGVHTYENGTCTGCGEAEPTEPDPGEDEESKTGWYLVTDVSELAVDDQIVIVAKDYNFALSTTQNNNNRGQATIGKSQDKSTIEEPSTSVQVLNLEVGTVDGTFAFNTGSGYLYAASSGNNYLRTQVAKDANGSWIITIAADGTATIVAQGTYTRNTMQYNQSSSLFACYASASQKALVIYKYFDGPACEHTNTTDVEAVAATCTTAGRTEGVKCADCGTVISGCEEIAVLGHSYDDGVVTTKPGCETTGVKTFTCSACGDTKAEIVAATGHNFVNGECANDGCDKVETTQPVVQTVSMNIYANKGLLANKVITWSSGDITFQNAQASSTTAIRTNDSDHFRLYAKSTVTVSSSGGNLTKVVITCTGSSYVDGLFNAIKTGNGITKVEKVGTVITVTLDGTVDSFTTVGMTAQARINKIEVTYTK